MVLKDMICMKASYIFAKIEENHLYSDEIKKETIAVFISRIY